MEHSRGALADHAWLTPEHDSCGKEKPRLRITAEQEKRTCRGYTNWILESRVNVRD